MQIGLTGASGFVGRAVVKLAVRRGHEVIAFSRNAGRIVHDCIETRRFSLEEPPDLRGCETVIHLAGESVAGWWSRWKMERIRSTRVEGTRRIVEAIAEMPVKPEALICASAIGFYGDRGEEELTETAPGGDGFLSEVCRAWEAEARTAAEMCRVVHPRFGMVLGNDGGALPALKRVFRLGFGGPLSHGRQWVSWIHVEDAASLLLFAVENLAVQGVVNATAPWPVRNAELTRILARAVHRPAISRAPAFALRVVLRGFSRELLDSRRVLPQRALEQGFPFRFSELEPAIKDLFG
jgi:uncharacterized protein